MVIGFPDHFAYRNKTARSFFSIKSLISVRCSIFKMFSGLLATHFYPSKSITKEEGQAYNPVHDPGIGFD